MKNTHLAEMFFNFFDDIDLLTGDHIPLARLRNIFGDNTDFDDTINSLIEAEYFGVDNISKDLILTRKGFDSTMSLTIKL